MKICNQFIHITNQLYFLTTLIEILELHYIKRDEIIFDSSRTLYYCKIGSLLFAFIATRPDIAFAVFHLSKFNQQLEPQHYKAANQVFYYFFSMQDCYIRYREETKEFSLFIYASVIFFDDNTLDWKSFQRYIMKFFDKAIAQKINKIDIITISFIEVKLLIIL